jgi:hypothetical protein
MEQTIKDFLAYLEKRLQQYTFEIFQLQINDQDLENPTDYSEINGNINELKQIIEMYKKVFSKSL